MGRAGLVKKVITVKGKKGMSKRSYWVRASGAVKNGAKAAGGFVAKHKGKIAGAAALVGAAVIAHKSGALGGARLGAAMTRGAQKDRAGAAGGKESRMHQARELISGALRGAGHGVANNTKVGAQVRDARQHNAGIREGMNRIARENPAVAAPAPKPATTRSRKKKSS